MSGRVLRLDPAAHKVADALLPWFVNGTLDADERALVEQHITECARCRDEVEWLRELHAACAGLGSVGARLSAGRTRSTSYLLEAPAWHREEARQSLRAEPAVGFAEALDRGNGR